MLCAKFGETLPGNSGEEDENIKVYGQTDRQTNRLTDGKTTGANFSSQFSWVNTFISIS